MHDEHLRETGLIEFETLIDADLVDAMLKLAIGRARPVNLALPCQTAREQEVPEIGAGGE